MDLQEFYVQPVKGDDDLFAFRFDFIPEGKALTEGATADVVTETEDGDLIIEGYAAVFEGQDRQNENFTDGAFQEGIKAFMSQQASLCYEHNREWAIGKVLDLREEEGKGLYMKARVDGAIRRHPTLGVVYDQIKKGTLSALSIGGFFKRKLTEAGRKIAQCDFTEISVTPVPVHPGTNFAVVAGKALKDVPSIPEGVEDNIRTSDEEQINWLITELDGLFKQVEAAISQRKTTHTEATA